MKIKTMMLYQKYINLTRYNYKCLFNICITSISWKVNIPATVSQLVPEYPSVHEHVYLSLRVPSTHTAGYLQGEQLHALQMKKKTQHDLKFCKKISRQTSTKIWVLLIKHISNSLIK